MRHNVRIFILTVLTGLGITNGYGLSEYIKQENETALRAHIGLVHDEGIRLIRSSNRYYDAEDLKNCEESLYLKESFPKLREYEVPLLCKIADQALFNEFKLFEDVWAMLLKKESLKELSALAEKLVSEVRSIYEDVGKSDCENFKTWCKQKRKPPYGRLRNKALYYDFLNNVVAPRKEALAKKFVESKFCQNEKFSWLAKAESSRKLLAQALQREEQECALRDKSPFIKKNVLGDWVDYFHWQEARVEALQKRFNGCLDFSPVEKMVQCWKKQCKPALRAGNMFEVEANVRLVREINQFLVKHYEAAAEKYAVYRTEANKIINDANKCHGKVTGYFDKRKCARAVTKHGDYVRVTALVEKIKTCNWLLPESRFELEQIDKRCGLKA